MDIHHDTSLRFIFEDDFVFLPFKACIHFSLGKRVRLWLVVRSFICSFRIAHSIFTLTLRFCFSLIQPSTYNIFTCECGHGLDTSGMHLTCCLFGGQWIATHDAIQDIMYAFA